MAGNCYPQGRRGLHQRLPKAEQKVEQWQTAIHCLIGVAEGRNFMMHARIGAPGKFHR